MASAAVRDGFWLQQTHTNGEKLLDLAEDLAQTNEGRPGFVAAPVNVKPTVNRYYRRARAGGDAVLDPQGHLLGKGSVKRTSIHFPWLEEPRPETQAGWLAWMQKGFDDQLSQTVHGDAGAPSFVITPSPDIVKPGDTGELHDVLAAAAAIVQAHDGQPECWVGLHVDQAYLQDDALREILVEAMLAVPTDGIVFRSPQKSMPPVSNRKYVKGLKAVVAACSQNDIDVFLPNSGWLGWLAMGWGAWGFSAGLAGATWADQLEITGFNSPLEPPLPYFEPQLLKTVPWRAHLQLLDQPGYSLCDCPECVGLLGSHRLLEAQRHQIRHGNIEATKLTALPSVAARAAAVAGRLDEAIAFREGLSSAPLRELCDAKFLTFWRSLL
jgi:hypothetical protein